MDSRIRLTLHDEQKARSLAFAGGFYPQGEVYRLLRLALHEIDCLRENSGDMPHEYAYGRSAANSQVGAEEC